MFHNMMENVQGFERWCLVEEGGGGGGAEWVQGAIDLSIMYKLLCGVERPGVCKALGWEVAVTVRMVGYQH